MGSLLAVLMGWCLSPFISLYLLFTIILIPLGIWSSGRAEKILGRDSPHIVIDEISGMMIAFLALPHSLTSLAAAFTLFRLLDILKPPPLSRLQDLRGGWGIMADDIGAGILANLLLRLLSFGLSTG